jgi:pre-mRNA-splicing helicase BRR2
MAEREELQKRYAYHAMSNKVEQADRSSRRVRGSEGTGEVETLRGRRDIGRMGDRVEEGQPPPPPTKKAKHVPSGPPSRRVAHGNETILDLGNLTGYQPTTEQAKAAYESILTIIGSKALLGNQGPQVLRDAAEEVLATLKDPNLRDPERHETISVLLTGKSPRLSGGLSTEHFTALLQYGKQLDDYNKDQQLKDDDKVDDEMGVAVVFDESEDEANKHDDSEIDQNVVVDTSSSSSEDEEEGPEAEEDSESFRDVDEEIIVQGADDVGAKKQSRAGDRILSVHEIDAHFLQRHLAKHVDDADESAKLAAQVMGIIDFRTNSDMRECENRLLVLLGFDLFDTIKLILRNRVRVWACISMKRAQSDEERKAIEEALANEPTGEGKRVWEELHSKGRAENWTRDRMKGLADAFKSEATGDLTKVIDSVGVKQEDDETAMQVEVKEEANELDLDILAFPEGSHTMTNKECDLPDTSWRAMKKGYEEVHVPAVRSVIPKDERLIRIDELPSWTHAAFKGMEKLNRVQSKLCDVALRSSENLLLCAPTGAGKTNVACLTMMNILGQYRRDRQVDDDPDAKDSFDLSSFKIVYVAPMKALVQEVVKNFSERLEDYGVTVRELSGDSSLSRQQISETQLLVTTPEKWDVVTRQGEGRAFTQLVKLFIVDEIHLLHDERGPVLESIVARIIRQVETTSEPVRLVGLSATLPNYTDVATFLRVDHNKGLFFFDHSYRPVPLQMQYIGLTERNAFRRFQLQNEICYEKAIEQRRNGNQMLIFVHSRAETGKTAKALRDLALERDESTNFVREKGATQEILREESSAVKNADLKDVLPYGFAIHHAGMAREDRELVEDLFADRHIAVLVCTATLAWGVNLPAHAVIIKGTQIYDPSKGRWAELSPLDVLQMLGRAGRPQYDSEGEGIILTQHSELQYYLSLTNLQLPVESQLIKTLPDHLNAEIVLGTIQTISEAVDWLGYTFLFVRMLQNPNLYGISETSFLDDRTLKKRRLDLAHSAASILEKSHLVRYDRKSGALQATPLGRISSQFYISHSSMAVYSRHMRSNMSDIELLRLFSLSGEFHHITVREEEKLELTKLSGRVPIPVKESPNEASAKVNILLQAYISRLRLDGFALVADMAFIQQSAARIMRALFEIALRRNWSSLAKLCLDMSNMVSYRIWRSQSPLRQFKNVPEVVARKLERKSDIEWARYNDLTSADLGELVGVPKMGRVLHKLVQQFPRLELSAQIQPLTRSMLRIEVTLLPSFNFDVTIHGYVQLFHVIVEDVNGDTILHHELFSLKSSNADEEHVLLFSVPVLEPLPPAYFIRVMSDRWLHSTAVLPVSFSKMILPSKFSPPTELLDLQPLLPSALGVSALSEIFAYKEFNPIQTQVFHELFKTDKNCLVCAPSGAGKSTCAVFAVLRMLTTNADGVCVYIAPTDAIADRTFTEWRLLFGRILPSSSIVRLSGETGPDLKLLSQGKVVVSSAKQWDMVSRRWKQRKAVQNVALMIFDELHFLGGIIGPTLEVVISRTRYMIGQSEDGKTVANMRIVGLGASLANARDVGEWMGVSGKSLFNFSSKARPMPLEIFFQSFEQANYSARLMAMAKPVFSAVERHIGEGTAIVFTPSRRQAQLTAIDLMTFRDGQGLGSYVGKSVDTLTLAEIASTLREPALQQVVTNGIGFLHAGMIDSDWNTVVDLYNSGALRILVCPTDVCWKIRCVGRLVIIMGTEVYDGREGRHLDYPVMDILHMIGRHDPRSSGKCVLLCHAPKKDYLKKLIYDPVPIESHLDSYLHDPLNAEVVTKTVSSMQDAIDYLTWSFLYRRLPQNPTYYGLRGTSNVFLSEYLSEMIETVIGDLEESKCCSMSEEGDISPLNLGMIAAYYYVQYRTIELIASSVTEKTKIRGIMEILSAAWEFSEFPIRFGEDRTLKSLARTLPYTPPDGANYDANTKALILLQCHFSRKVIGADLRSDQKSMLKEAVNLVQSIVDVISSNGWLKPALAAMELSQMLVQGLWNKDHVLKQVPHFTEEIIGRCRNHDEPVETVFDILTIEDDVRNQLLQLPDDKMADVAVFCNTYPSIEVSFKVHDVEDVAAGNPVQIVVELEREVDEDDMDEDDMDEAEMEALGTVAAPLFPIAKKEGWWVVVGDTSTNSLLSLKRVNLRHKQKLSLDFLAPDEPGDYDLTLFCMSDSYLGCDQEYRIPLSVAAAESDESEEDE